MSDEERFDLAQELLGVHRLDQHFVRAFFAPLGAGQRKGGEHRHGRVVGSLLGGAHHVDTGGVALHAHVGDNHVIGVGAELLFRLAGGGGRFHLKAIDFEHCLEGEQDREFVIYEQDATFHRESLSVVDHFAIRAMRATGRILRLGRWFCPLVKLNNVAEYHVENFGCRASRADGEAIASELRQHGLIAASDSAYASVVVLNTCSVTAAADRDARAYLRRVRRENPKARILVTGCYAQRAPEELAALSGVDAVIGNSHKARVAEAALALAGQSVAFVPLSSLMVDPSFAHSELAALPFFPDARQTRPNLKIQDGCGNRCSFCIIPTTRGPSRSVSLEECLRSVKAFVESGGQELVLSGINLGRWGRDLAPARRFEELVTAVLERTSLPRLRISSVEPMDWSAELIALFQQYGQDQSFGPRLARHAHLPLQSGSDAILRAMHRRYRPWHYAEKIAAIHAAVPDAARGADVMVGFPGETDSLFQASYDFIAGLPFTYLHLFPFSARPGTAAYELHRLKPVADTAVKERMAALRSLIAEKNRTFRSRFMGRDLVVITLSGGDTKRTPALSDNFIKIELAGSFAANRLLRVRIPSLTADGMHGERIHSAGAVQGDFAGMVY